MTLFTECVMTTTCTMFLSKTNKKVKRKREVKFSTTSLYIVALANLTLIAAWFCLKIRQGVITRNCSNTFVMP